MNTAASRMTQKILRGRGQHFKNVFFQEGRKDGNEELVKEKEMG